MKMSHQLNDDNNEEREGKERYDRLDMSVLVDKKRKKEDLIEQKKLI